MIQEAVIQNAPPSNNPIIDPDNLQDIHINIDGNNFNQKNNAVGYNFNHDAEKLDH